MENNKTIEQIIVKFENQYQKTHVYVPLQSYSLNFSDEEKEIIVKKNDLFFMASKSRILLIVWLCKVIRDAFELYNYSDLEMPIETYEIMRNTFRTKAFNRSSFLEIFECTNTNFLTYPKFVELEQKYIRAYNEYAPAENKLSLMTHIGVKTIEEKIAYNRELKNILYKPRNKEVILERANGKTLEEIGESLGITRERTRQIEFKPRNDIERWLVSRDSDIYSDIGRSNGLMNQEKAAAVLGEDEWAIVKYVIARNSDTDKLPWKFFEPLGIVYHTVSPTLPDLLDKTRQKMESKRSSSIVKSFTETIQSHGYGFWDEKMTNEYFKACNYNIIDKTLQYGKITIGKAILFVSKKYYPEGIKITDTEALKDFVGYIDKEFGIKLKHKRALTTRIQDILVMRGKAEYVSDDKINVDEKLLPIIEEYVNNLPSNQVSYEVVYNALYEDISKYSNIDNFYFLHGVMKYYSEKGKLDVNCNRYYVGKSTHSQFTSKEFFQPLYEFLRNTPKAFTVEELSEKFPEWNPLYFRYSMNYFPSIVQWEKGKYLCMEAFKFNSKDIAKLKQFVDECTDNKYGYTSSYKVYNTVKENDPELLKKLHITNETNAFYVIQHLVDGKFYRKPHILRDTSVEHFSTSDLVRLELKGKKKINKKELTKKLVDLYGEKNSSLILAIQKELGSYRKINSNEYENN